MNMNPDQAVAGQLTGFGRMPARFANKRQIGPNEFEAGWESATVHGMAWFRIFPRASGNVITMRTANTSPRNWQRGKAEAAAVARSLTCK